METVFGLKTVMYPVKGSNGIEYWEIKISNVKGIYYGGARCMNEASLFIGFKELGSMDEAKAIDYVVSMIKENL
ncbi:hypothetical protein IRV21_25885 [Bacillus cereus]|uniref:hypothetical protein n=1 Tax=Bacillus cereus group TaxID=86661 RepID=UPI00077A500A|nr:hypothetical protein [Bacillus cereus]KXY95158.1 hypothetical protein AT279_21815 [Bacillus cereus]MBL3785628.1 hypothetical protein [Bacillus cereus]MBL3802431.1 hypothetical protein [Bacillus cereus]MBL3817425.1 hypothetical protein [Bacillus cereus]